MSKENAVKNLFHINKEPQQKLLSYFFSNPNEIVDFPLKYFISSELQQIAQAIVTLVGQEIKFTLDELTTIVKKKNIAIEFDHLNNIKLAFTDFTNIDLVKREVKEQYIKYNLFNQIVKDITVNLTQEGTFDQNKLRGLAENLNEKLDELENEKLLYTVDDYIPSYNDIIKNRSNNIIQRTFGFSNLNSIITRPLTPGEISIIFGLSGSYKSNFCLNIVNQLISMKIPVLYFSLENTIDEDVMDRLLAIRENIAFTLLDTPAKDERIKRRIQEGIARMREIQHLLMPNLPSLSISSLDTQIGKSKKLFDSKQLFKSGDKYFVVAVDMLTQLTDFKDMKPGVIEMIMNNLQIVARKHNVPILGVVHANENRLRGKTFHDPEDLNKFFLTKEDIKYGSAIADKSKGVVISLRRLKDLKMRFFPELNEITAKEPDILDCFIVKQNKGFPGMVQFGITDSLKTIPYKSEDNFQMPVL